MASTKIAVKQVPEREVPLEVLAQSIVKISEAAMALRRSGFAESALLILLAARSKQSQKTCKIVLDAMLDLKATYLSAQKKS
jgi:hypothetical protein